MIARVFEKNFCVYGVTQPKQPPGNLGRFRSRAHFNGRSQKTEASSGYEVMGEGCQRSWIVTYTSHVSSGRSSGVEHDLAKVGVEGSSPFARSKISR